MADFRPGSVSWELPNGISMHMWINTHTTHGQILQLSGTRGYMTGITPSSARTTHFVGQWGALDICRIHARTSSHMKQQGERKKTFTHRPAEKQQLLAGEFAVASCFWSPVRRTVIFCTNL